MHVCVHITCMCAYMCACMRACTHFSNDSCIALGYDCGLSRPIMSNMITHAHSIRGPCFFFSNA